MIGGVVLKGKMRCENIRNENLSVDSDRTLEIDERINIGKESNHHFFSKYTFDPPV